MRTGGKLIFLRLIEKANNLKNSNPEEALKVLDKAEEIGINHPKLLGIRSIALKNLGKINEAIENARDNCRMYNNSVSYGILAQIYLAAKMLKKSLEAAEKGVKLSNGGEISVSIFEKIKERKEIAFSLTQEANALKKENPEKALILLEQVEEVDLYSVHAAGIKCECFLGLGRNIEALESAKKGIELSKSATSYYLLSLAFTANEMFEKAVDSAETCIKLSNFMNGKNLFQLLLSHCQFARFKKISEKTNKKIDEAIDLFGKNSFSEEILNYSHVLRKEKFYETTIKLLSYADRNDPRTDLCEAFCQMHLGRFFEAMKLFEQAEEKIEKTQGETQKIRLKTRRACGIIFLCKNIFKFWEFSLIPKAEEASMHLLTLKSDEIGNMQEDDYRESLKIIEDSFPDLYPDLVN